MATRPMNMFEKLANSFGVLYRHQKAQFPRRFGLLKGVAKRELAPPKQADWPVIKKEFNQVVQYIQSGTYKNLTVREGLVYSAIALEITFWFFVGEMIGRRHVFGYLVGSDYVSCDTKKKVAEIKAEEEKNRI